MYHINRKTVAVFAIILIAAIFTIFRFSEEKTAKISYRTVQIDRNDILSSIKATGSVNPITTIDIEAQVSGVIRKIYVDFDSKVKKNELLAEIDPSLFENKLKFAHADYIKAQSDFKIAESAYKTNNDLYIKSLIPQDKFDIAQANYSSMLAAYNQSKSALEIAESNLKNTKIRSPIDGVLLVRNVNIGQDVTQGGPPLFVVASSLTKMKLEINVSEVHIGKVKVGQMVDFTVDAYPNEIFHGNVSQILYDPANTNNIITYKVIASIDNVNLMLKPGMTAEVNIKIADEQNVLRVPTAALRFIPPPSAITKEKPDEASKGSYVWILLKDGQIAPIEVIRGVSDDTYTEIKGGNIREGQSVIVESSISGRGSKLSNAYFPQPGRF